MASLETFRKDLSYAARTMRRSPAFAITSILTLALGIGSNTAMFTVIHSVLLKPLEYRDSGRLVRVTGGATPARFEQIKGAHSYSEVGAFTTGMENVTLTGPGDPEALKAARVSANFLSILGVNPLLGRSFLPAEDVPGGAAVAMISAELWQRRFGGDPRIAGKTAAFTSAPYTIIGVLPAGFQFPFAGVDVWMTRPVEWSVIPQRSRTLSPILSIFARLRDRVSADQASAELAVINRQYAAIHPGMLDSKPGQPEHVQPMKDQLVADVRSMLWMLFGAVGFVLMIACANVASLLLARAASRSQELAVRAALGAARGRLIGQLLAESLLLALPGGALGVLLARWSVSGIAGMRELNLPRADEIRLDGAVLGFALLLSIATGLLFGLAPSLGASRPDLAGVLRAHGEGARGAFERISSVLSARGALVAGQAALSVVLLIGAGLLMQSLARVESVDPGFQPAHLLTMRVALAPARYDTVEKRSAFYDGLVGRAESLPGVRGAAVTLTLPMTGFMGTAVQITGQPERKLNERPIVVVEDVTPGYFHTMGIPLRRGRDFTDRDTLNAPLATIVAESFARRFWPAYPNGPDPIGQHLVTGTTLGGEIIGIVGDVRQAGLSADIRPELYRPCAQAAMQTAMLAIRTEGDPAGLVNAVRAQVRAIDPDQAVSNIRTMEQVVEASEGQRRLVVTLLDLFAGAALLLALVGIYGVIAYSVAQRTRELGIRRALGARESDILKLVVSRGLGLSLAGVAAGIGGALALTRVMKSLLFEVSATDPRTFAGVALLFLAVALAASYLPARRAARIDPMTALR